MAAEFDRIGKACVDEMQEIIRAQLDRLGAMHTQVDATWSAQAAITDTYRTPPVARSTGETSTDGCVER